MEADEITDGVQVGNRPVGDGAAETVLNGADQVQRSNRVEGQVGGEVRALGEAPPVDLQLGEMKVDLNGQARSGTRCSCGSSSILLRG